MHIAMRVTAPNPFEDESLGDEVEDLLALYWYPYMAGYRWGKGLGQNCPMFKDAVNEKGNVHIDDADAADATDERIRRIMAEAIESCVDQLPHWKLRVAVELRVANRRGPVVWRSGRLTPEQLAEAWLEARQILAAAFESRGLMRGLAKSMDLP